MAKKTPQPTPINTLTLRDLNRATLARQMLLACESMGVVEAIERLAGMQAQYSPSPYIGLWTRLDGFRIEDLTRALLSREVVKASLMRWTLHLASARDYPYFARAVAESRIAGWRPNAERAGVDPSTLHKGLLEFAAKPRLLDEMREFVEGGPVPRSPTSPPVHHEVLGTLGHIRVEVVHQHPERGLLQPPLALQGSAVRGANYGECGIHYILTSESGHS